MYGYYGFSLPDGSDAGPDMFLHTHVVQYSTVYTKMHVGSMQRLFIHNNTCEHKCKQLCKVMHLSGTATAASCMKRLASCYSAANHSRSAKISTNQQSQYLPISPVEPDCL